MDSKIAFEKMMAQLALEYNTEPDAFKKEGLTFTTPVLRDGRRVYSHEMPFFAMATTGNSVVIAADAQLHESLRALAEEAGDLHRLYEFHNLQKIEALLKPYGYGVRGAAAERVIKYLKENQDRLCK